MNELDKATALAEELIKPHLAGLEKAVGTFADQYCICFDFNLDKATARLFELNCVSAITGQVVKSNIAEDITIDVKGEGRFVHQIIYIGHTKHLLTKAMTLRVAIALDDKVGMMAMLLKDQSTRYGVGIQPSRTNPHIFNLHIKPEEVE